MKVKAREFYEARAKALIKKLRDDREMSYADLALRLQSYGVVMSERVLINRINRGTFTFSFAMMVLDALNADMLEIPKHKDIHPVEHRDGEALTKVKMDERVKKLLKKQLAHSRSLT
jgi:hypothetical protein